MTVHKSLDPKRAPWECTLVELLKKNFAPDILESMARHSDLSELAHQALLEIGAWPEKKKAHGKA